MRGLGKEEREDIGIGEIDLVEIDKYIGIRDIDRVDNIISSIEGQFKRPRQLSANGGFTRTHQSLS